MDYGVSWHNINYTRLVQGYNTFGQVEYFPEEDSTYSTILPSLSWVFDNSVMVLLDQLMVLEKILL